MGFLLYYHIFFHESDSFAVKENAVPGIRLTTKKKEELAKIEKQSFLGSKIVEYDVSALQIKAYSAYNDPFQEIKQQISNKE